MCRWLLLLGRAVEAGTVDTAHGGAQDENEKGGGGDDDTDDADG